MYSQSISHTVVSIGIGLRKIVAMGEIKESAVLCNSMYAHVSEVTWCIYFHLTVADFVFLFVFEV